MYALSALVLAALACTPAVLARVNGMFAPSTVYSGQNFTGTLEIQSYIQNWDDFGVSRSLLVFPPRAPAVGEVD